MGHTSAETIKRYREENLQNLLNEAFFEAQFRNHLILIKAKVCGYGEDQRTNFFATRVMTHSFKEENRELLKRLEIYSKIPDYQADGS